MGLSDLSSVDEYQATPMTRIGSPMGLPGWPPKIKVERKDPVKSEKRPCREKRERRANLAKQEPGVDLEIAEEQVFPA